MCGIQKRNLYRSSKIEAITQWPRPMNATEIRSFLGLAGYYHIFVQNFSIVAISLTNFTRKATEYIDKRRAAFKSLRRY